MNLFPAQPRTTQETSTSRILVVTALAALTAFSITACGPASDPRTAARAAESTIPSPGAGTDGASVPSATPDTTDSQTTAAEGPGPGSVFFAGAEDVEATVSLPAGWAAEEVFVFKQETDPIVHLAFFDVANIYADPCRWALLDPPVGPTVDDLALAFEHSTVFAVTTPVDVTVDGFPGKYIEVTVPDYDEEECKDFGLYREDRPVDDGNHNPNYWAQAPQQTLDMWILEVDGTRLVVSAGHYPDTSDQDREEVADMVATLDIG